MNTIEKDQKYIAHAYHRYPVCFVSGKGSILTDEDGKEYIDLGSGIKFTSMHGCNMMPRAVFTNIMSTPNGPS